jgi:hypothetical protein
VLEQALAKGLVAHGWPDQTWTLLRIKTLIGRRFHKSRTLSAIALCFEDEAGFSMTPPTTRTCCPVRTHTLIRVRGRSQRRFSIAALARYKSGERSGLIYRLPKRHVDHKRRQTQLRLDRLP